jgi:hypothetical protein
MQHTAGGTFVMNEEARIGAGAWTREAHRVLGLGSLWLRRFAPVIATTPEAILAHRDDDEGG